MFGRGRHYAKVATKNFTQVPLFVTNFNLDKYKTDGPIGSCSLMIHPNLQDDNHIRGVLNELCNYITSNYEMDKIV